MEGEPQHHVGPVEALVQRRDVAVLRHLIERLAGEVLAETMQDHPQLELERVLCVVLVGGVDVDADAKLVEIVLEHLGLLLELLRSDLGSDHLRFLRHHHLLFLHHRLVGRRRHLDHSALLRGRLRRVPPLGRRLAAGRLLGRRLHLLGSRLFALLVALRLGKSSLLLDVLDSRRLVRRGRALLASRACGRNGVVGGGGGLLAGGDVLELAALEVARLLLGHLGSRKELHRNSDLAGAHAHMLRVGVLAVAALPRALGGGKALDRALHDAVRGGALLGWGALGVLLDERVGGEGALKELDSVSQ
mmetsp:Transcript_9364/g.18132  ORF Transcript_9364/g.18132 Transcript_9364/m.18132 type:complete len:304 (-) Transcript_9364:116-1027(-)